MPRQRPYRRSSSLGLRAIVFTTLSLALVAGVAYSLWPTERPLVEVGPVSSPGIATRTVPPAATVKPDLTMRIDMSGFAPSRLQLPADRSLRLLIVNPDSSHHSDGGGVHQFAVPALGIDVKVPPETNMLVTLPASGPGEYAFYCDTCCGGKENPTMQGVLKVGA